MSIIGDLKDIGMFLQKAGNADLYSKLIEIQEKAIEIMEKNRELKEENSKLLDALRIKNSLEFQDEVYWMKNKDGTLNGPYCPKCYDDEGKLLRLVSCPDPTYSQCLKCKYVLETSWKKRR